MEVAKNMGLRIGLLGMPDNSATRVLLLELHRLGRRPDIVILLEPDINTQWRRLKRKLRAGGLLATASRIAYALSTRMFGNQGQQNSEVVPWPPEIHYVRNFNNKKCRWLIRNADLDILLLSTDSMIGRRTFSLPRYGTLNAHPGWIPAYRGLGSMLCMARDGIAPAISVHLVDEGVDTGPLILRKTIDPVVVERGDEAEHIYFIEQARMFVRVIDMIEQGKASPIDTFLEQSNMTRGIQAKEARTIQAKVRSRQHDLQSMEDRHSQSGSALEPITE
jgi:hypothetical protein